MKGTLRRCSSSLHTTSFNSSSSNKFGSFILLVSANTYTCARSSTSLEESNSLIMLSSSSVSESDESSSECGDWPWRYDDGKLFHLGGSKDQSMKVELDNDDDEKEDQQQQLVVVLRSLGVPLLNFNEIVGSCEGLICLSSDHNIPNLLCLWNPATKTSRILPKPEDIGGTHHLFAFGFDVETKDYKVVKVTGFCGEEVYRPVSPIECICRVQVYSLSTDSWRLLEGITCLPGDPFGCPDEERVVLYLNGSCFFLAKFFHTRRQPCFPESDRFIISFDFAKEIITPIQLPDHHQDQKLYLSSLGDEMALFTKSYSHNGTREHYNIWVLKKEYNGSSNSSISIRSVSKESWTNLHSFLMEAENPVESYTPIGLSNDGEFALLQTCGSFAFGKKIKLYHFATEEVKSFLSCDAVRSKAIAYKPSLVSIIGGNGAAATAADRRR